MPHKEIAAVMGISAANSQKKYQRAVSKLRKVYDYEKPKSQKNIKTIRFNPDAG
jgi:DNA-directed RNA polymerase specialized sigma24 family protein